jgi:hypothetical protein
LALFARPVANAVAEDSPAAVQVLLLTPTPAEDSARWASVVRGLRAVGQRALQVADLPLDPVFAACRSAECAEQVARSSQLTAALFTFLSVQPTAAGPSTAGPQLELRVFEPAGRQATVRTSLVGRPLAQAAAELFEASRRQLALGDGALLSIASRPVGAIVWLDGKPLGVTPFEHALPAGAHTLRITLGGFVSDEQPLQLTQSELRTVGVRLTREPGPRLAKQLADPRGEASPWNYVIGGVLGVAAMPTLISGVNAWANDGQCLEADAHGCKLRGHFGERSALLLAVGGLALAGAVYWFVALPIRLEAAPMLGGAQLRVRANF